MADVIAVVPPNPRWALLFAAERDRLRTALGLWLADDVVHIGSTAVPGLAAKPVLDVLAGVRSLDEARAALPVLEGLGYVVGEHRPSEAHWLSRPGTVPVQLHLTEPTSLLWRERLAFRDALLASPDLRAEYADLKHRLAADGLSLRDYTGGKRAFVARVLAGAGIALD